MFQTRWSIFTIKVLQ